MTLRLLYVIDSLVPGGAERSLAALAPAFASRGVHLDVAYLEERDGLQNEFSRAGANLFFVGSGGRMRRVQRLRQLISRRRPDLIHTTLFEANVTGRLAASLTNTPVVSSIVNVSYGPEQYSSRRMQNAKLRVTHVLDAGTAQLVSRFHAVTEYLATVMSRRLKVRRGRIDVIPRGRDSQHLGTRSDRRRTFARQALGISPSDVVILAAGRHERQKGLEILLEAFPLVLHELPAARLVIAGRDGGHTSLLHFIAERRRLDGQVRFLGPRDDVPELLCAADAFVLPSLWEGMPGVVLEAMALETPIVASDLAGVREAVGSEEAAYLVPPGRADTLAGALIDALRDRANSIHRASIARARFLERFTIDRVADAMAAFYYRALA